MYWQQMSDSFEFCQTELSDSLTHSVNISLRICSDSSSKEGIWCEVKQCFMWKYTLHMYTCVCFLFAFLVNCAQHMLLITLTCHKIYYLSLCGVYIIVLCFVFFLFTYFSTLSLWGNSGHFSWVRHIYHNICVEIYLSLCMDIYI